MMGRGRRLGRLLLLVLVVGRGSGLACWEIKIYSADIQK